MNEALFNKMNQICHQISRTRCKRLFLYPFGYKGTEIYEFLKARTNYEIIGVDRELSKRCDRVITFDEMLSEGDWENIDGTDMVILTSNNPVCFSEIRLKVGTYIKKELVTDVFPKHPLCYHKDVRIGALTVVAENIYRQGIRGSVAEAGVYRGDFSKYINMLFPDRKLYLFDTFDGFDRNQLDLKKDEEEQTDYWIDALKNTSEELVMSKMNYPGTVEIRKGLFPETAEGVEDNFAFVSLDMDIYMPTYEGLKFFWERLSPGGTIFVHDFGNWNGIDKAVEEFCKEFHTGYVPLNDGLSVALTKGL